MFDWSPEALTALRVDHGYAVWEMAAIIGVEPETIWRWETGRSRPRRHDVRNSLRDFAERHGLDVAVVREPVPQPARPAPGRSVPGAGNTGRWKGNGGRNVPGPVVVARQAMRRCGCGKPVEPTQVGFPPVVMCADCIVKEFRPR